MKEKNELNFFGLYGAENTHAPVRPAHTDIGRRVRRAFTVRTEKQTSRGHTPRIGGSGARIAGTGVSGCA